MDAVVSDIDYKIKKRDGHIKSVLAASKARVGAESGIPEYEVVGKLLRSLVDLSQRDAAEDIGVSPGDVEPIITLNATILEISKKAERLISLMSCVEDVKAAAVNEGAFRFMEELCLTVACSCWWTCRRDHGASYLQQMHYYLIGGVMQFVFGFEDKLSSIVVRERPHKVPPMLLMPPVPPGRHLDEEGQPMSHGGMAPT